MGRTPPGSRSRSLKIHTLTIDEALHSLGSHEAGLSHLEAERRLVEFGPNEVEAFRETPLWSRLLREFTHFFAFILWVAAALAFFADWKDPGSGMGQLGFAILGVILINGIFSFWQEHRAEKAIHELQKILPRLVKTLRDGWTVQVPASSLVPGDVIHLSEGDVAPADCRLLQAFGIRINEATLTGESLPRGRDCHPSDASETIHARNLVLAGSTLVSGNGRALVFATGMRTELGKIAHLTQSTVETPSPLQVEIARVSRLVALLAVLIGVVSFFIGRAMGLPFWGNFLFAIGIIVANVPEGLLPTLTLALAMGGQRMARRHALIRHLPAVETLGCTTVICTDKTGTLTENRMVAREVLLPGRAGWLPLERIGPLTGHETDLFRAALHCHDLKRVERPSGWEWAGDPMEVALVRMAGPIVPGEQPARRLEEIPFDSDRRRMSTLHAAGEGFVLHAKGAPEVMLNLCGREWLGEQDRPLSPDRKKQLLVQAEAMAEQGYRILAFANRTLPRLLDRDRLEEDLTFTGLVALEDPPRSEVPEAIRKCRQAGIRVVMVTGDHPRTALTVGREIGLVRSASPAIVTGEELRGISDTQLQLLLRAEEVVFARVDADQKMRIVAALKERKEIVAVTGDGVNDAPALKLADIGIAMGLTGTEVAREASDIILADDNFASIVAAVEEGRAVFANTRKFITYIFTSNIPELVPYLAFALLRIPLALTIIQILAVDLGTDLLPALALGAEKPDPGLMGKPPRSRAERLLSLPVLLRSYLFLGVMEAAAAMAAFFITLQAGGWSYPASLDPSSLLYRQATMSTLAAIIVMQIANLFCCRSDRESAFTSRFSDNPLIAAGLAAEILLLLLIAYTPWGNRICGTAPIALETWLFILPCAAGMLMLEEARKWVMRRWL
jgi:sodium/potassium-transporting ATPase subunit alpha